MAAVFHLLFQSCHPLLQVELKTLVGLCEESVHRVREPLVVLLVHLFSLSSLKGTKCRRVKSSIFKVFVQLVDLIRLVVIPESKSMSCCAHNQLYKYNRLYNTRDFFIFINI